jgi:sulfur-oxidizing protein SoxY
MPKWTGRNLIQVLLGVACWAALGLAQAVETEKVTAEPDFFRPGGQDTYIAELLQSAKDSKEDPQHAISFDVPPVVEDGGVVPISLQLNHPMEPDHYIRSIDFFDENSLIKLKAIARFSPEIGRAQLSTSIRLAKSTRLKAVAECNLHGRWLSVSPEVQVGESGCGAAIARPTLNFSGNILKVKFLGRARKGKPRRINLTVKHPMESGITMEKDGKTTRSFPAFFMKDIRVFYGGNLVSEFQLGPGLSNNPVLGFNLQTDKNGPLKLKATNTEGQSFEDSISLKGATEDFF